jgi:hypothetical protein
MCRARDAGAAWPRTWTPRCATRARAARAASCAGSHDDEGAWSSDDDADDAGSTRSSVPSRAPSKQAGTAAARAGIIGKPVESRETSPARSVR